MTTGRKRHNTPQVARRRKPPAADANEKIALLKRERDEALEREAATAEVLKVISRSTFDLQAVLETLVQSAGKLCQAENVQIFLRDGEFYRLAADNGFSPEYQQYVREHPIRPGRGTLVARTALGVVPVQIPDRLADPEYTYHEGGNLGGYRTMLGVPLVRDGNCIGVIALTRSKVRPFTDKQIELVKNFAAQAVIAIENTRLLNELRQRTDDLAEALEQQTATSEVLKIISSSPGELEPVFQTMLENAVRICEATFGVMFRYDGRVFRAAAWRNVPAAYEESLRQRGSFQPDAGAPLYRLTQTKELVQTADEQAEPNPGPAAKIGGARSLIAVPMRKENELIGAFVIYRTEIRPFSDKQIELVQNFANQAVIAIENTRLLNELTKLNQQLEQRVEDQVGEIERMGRLRRFLLPPQVADLIVASGSEKQLESHRREITALFCDLRGFTGFSESSDPEDVMALLRDYHAAIGEIIIKYSGTLERYAGDGVMVIFNDPVPVPDPALRAVKMALDMRVTIGALIENWRRLGHDLGFGIGIAHGFATLGTIGFEGRFDYAAIGTVSNVASRLCDEAKPGQILISPRVLMAVEKDVTVEPIGEFALKGIRRPMVTYNVLAASIPKTSHE
jgi:adenylate cyclase